MNFQHSRETLSVSQIEYWWVPQWNLPETQVFHSGNHIFFFFFYLLSSSWWQVWLPMQVLRLENSPSLLSAPVFICCINQSFYFFHLLNIHPLFLRWLPWPCLRSQARTADPASFSNSSLMEVGGSTPMWWYFLSSHFCGIFFWL